MEKFKKYALVTLAIFICLSFSSNMVLALDIDTKDMGSKTITETNKVWIISFKSEVDVSSLSNNVQVKDITTGNIFTPTVSDGNNIFSVKINAPSGGYVAGHKYQLILNKGIKSKKGNVLPKTTILTFSIGAKDGSSYDASANVVVSPVFAALKQITLTSTNLPSDTKFQIEGNNKVFNIGDTTVSMVGGSTVNVYFYSSDGTTQIGTAVLDVSSTNNNINIKITN